MWLDSIRASALGATWLLIATWVPACNHESRTGQDTEREQVAESADGGREMTREELMTKLRLRSAKEQSSIATEVGRRARSEAQMIVDLWVSTDDDDVEGSARSVVLELADLSISPMIEAPPPADPFRRALLLDFATSNEIALRQRLMVRLDQMLDDKSIVPVLERPGPQPERREPKRRICDEAYVHIWTVMHFGQPMMDAVHERNRLLSLSDEARDADIRDARTSRAWRIALGWREDDIDAADAARAKAGKLPARR